MVEILIQSSFCPLCIFVSYKLSKKFSWCIMAPLSWSLWPKKYLVQMLKLLALNCTRWFWKLSPCLVNTKANTSCYGFGFLDPSFITESHQGQFVPIILYYCNPKTASEFKMNSNFVKSVKKCINPSTFPLITGRNYNVYCNTFYCNNFFFRSMSMGFLVEEGAPIVWRGLMVSWCLCVMVVYCFATVRWEQYCKQ